MKLNVSIDEISDGKLYSIRDMVKADTKGCIDCNACCHGVGDTIVLNPFDMYNLLTHLKTSYDDLIGTKVSLHLEEKIRLPHLKMIGDTEACGFLDENGRCSIHSSRPSICRLFPLGRYYEEDDFKYFIKPGECVKPQLSKIKVKKWISIDRYKENKAFILNWHFFLKALKWRVRFIHDDQELEEVNRYLLNTFYKYEWHEEKDFYDLYNKKIIVAKDKLGVL